MVIHQFNKLIRNRWVWGVFAVAISAFFAFDFLIPSGGGDPEGRNSVGTLGGDPVTYAEFQAVANSIRGLGRNRDNRRGSHEVNLEAWKTLAALKTAERNGIFISDQIVHDRIAADPTFAENGAFNVERYRKVLAAYDIRPEEFEAFLRQQLTLEALASSAVAASMWVSPFELDRAMADQTDKLTVRVINFKQTKEDAAAVTLNDEILKSWYDKNSSTLELPERFRLRYVKFDGNLPAVQAKMPVTEELIVDTYNDRIDKYTSKDTNGVEVVKKLDEVRGELEKELRRDAAVEFYLTNLNERVFVADSASVISRLDQIAAEDSLKVQTSGWIAVTGKAIDGFAVRPESIFPGVSEVMSEIRDLDSMDESNRYALFASGSSVWLVEKGGISPAHLPDFEESKSAIGRRALAAARHDAFKASVDAIRAKGLDAILAAGTISTNVTFSACEGKAIDIPNRELVVMAAVKLDKGGISDFVPSGSDTGLIIVCDDRVPGDATQALLMKSQIRSYVSQAINGDVAGDWRNWNLQRLGYTTTAQTSVEDDGEFE